MVKWTCSERNPGRRYIRRLAPSPEGRGVVHFPEITSKGGVADVEEMAVCYPASYHHSPDNRSDHTVSYHNSVLAARLDPERLTFLVN